MTIRELSVLFLLCTTLLFSQHFKIQVGGSNEKKAAVFSLSGEKTAFVDSIVSTTDGIWEWDAIPIKYHSGIYRFICKNGIIDFVYDGAAVSLKTSAGNAPDSLEVISSESNKLYYSFLMLNKAYKNKSELLQLILARFPRNDEYYALTKTRLASLQQEYLDFVEKQSQHNPKSFIARYIRSARLPATDGTMPPDKQLVLLRAHGLDFVDFDDSELTNSDLFTNKSIEYLMYYRNPQLTRDLLEKEFIGAVDSLLNKAKKNPFVYSHITEYLVDGFKKFGFDRVIDYIIENYVIKDDICLDQKLETTLQRRMDQSRKFKIGMKVPNIQVPDSTGKIIEFTSINTKQTLLIFYASWCPHCQDMLPKLAELYNAQKEKTMEIVAVSIDTNRTDWLKFVTANTLNWLNVCDLKGWNGSAASAYYLYATPTMFLVNSKMEIVAKPSNIEEVNKWWK